MIRFPLLLLLSIPFFACSPEESDPPVVITPPVISVAMKIDILALGDSYTIGQSVAMIKNFPNQLKENLLADTFDLLAGTPRIIAQTGWRTDQLINAVSAATDIKDSVFSLVTLCIGVNNQYQHGDFNDYKSEFETLLKTAITRTGNRKDRVIVLSIPDWAYTPYGQNFPGGGASISAEIDEYNAANKLISTQYGVPYVNVTDISRQGLVRPELVASDGLHPSAVQYAEWIQLILPVAKAALMQ